MTKLELAEKYNKNAIALIKKQQYKKAIVFFKKSLKVAPLSSPIHNNLGIIYLKQKDYKKAILEFKLAISSDPKNAKAFNNLGNAYKYLSELDRAILNYKKSLNLNPGKVETLDNLGLAYFEKDNLSESIKSFKQAINKNPNFPKARLHLSFAFMKSGKLKEAFEQLSYYLKLTPEDTYAVNILANFYKQTGQLARALKLYNKAAFLEPNSPEALNNLAAINIYLGNHKPALKALKKALDINPKLASAYYHLGLIFEKKGRNPLIARKYYEKALKLNPQLTLIHSIIAFMLMQECNWQGFKEKVDELDKILVREAGGAKEISETPFINVIRCDDPKMNFLVAKAKSDAVKRSVSAYYTSYVFKKPKKKKIIKVGYLSNDFHVHATMHLAKNLFSSHDKSHFQIYVYSYDSKDYAYVDEIVKEVHKFRDIYKLGFRQAADLIYKDGVDILVDLKGHTRETRREICALKPAPIQISYLGFPGTTGADYCDYIITDHVVTPASSAKYFSEKLIYLPDSYQINDDKREIAKIKFTREDFNLPRGFVFSCFNHVYKIDEKTFTSWMKILKRVPNGILWLLDDNETAKKNIWAKAKSLKVSPKRIIFSASLAHRLHLRRLDLSNLSLDTFICNGHTTTSDSLWAGVPVITLFGKHFASRVSASLLTAIGLPELITHSPKEYEDLAVRLAQNPDELLKLKLKLKSNIDTYPLFDTERFVKNLEKAYTEVWEIYLKGEKSKEIEIKND